MSVRQWKYERPFTGSLLTLISGALTLWVPLNLIVKAFLPGTVSVIGIFFGGMILLLGAIAMSFPQFSKVLGIITIFLSILSVIGALGGFLIGTLLGITGGSLMIAWNPPAPHQKNDDQNVAYTGYESPELVEAK
ncbi:hypothetical protein SAMN04488137_0219 [Fictibacillus solisalsi]|uniref:Uncharacterized protein n=1 Tax=Fictibacillus solisalsi TaxID=459525 RepID=A0A1G9TD53_9BACL|nr:DUF6114 domain-containing protein [Fictibacillus solisalsi]SDM45597.1 hypothetical protein SAMN04488137_0219 [Fictibacillus solisalsi]